MSDRVYGTDLVTFTHPSFWGAQSHDDAHRVMVADPRRFWDRVLDASQQAGLGTLELTFPPADAASAVRAFGSVDGFRDALAAHALGIHSSYFGALEEDRDLTDAGVRDDVLARARTEVALLADLGTRYLVMGPPYPDDAGARRTPEFVAAVGSLADAVGEIAAEKGLTAALHPESYSLFWRPDDVAALLDATDPALVGFCPDAGHLAVAGADPAEVLRAHADRYAMAHWKDATAVGPETPPDDLFPWLGEIFVPPGSGRVDWSAWIDVLGEVSDMSTVVLEIDAAPDPVAALTSARTYIDGLIDG
ncbi:sugar phosphate isomerase/epimerase [Nocardioides maradonensis]